MLKHVYDNLGFAGLVLLIGGWFAYTLNGDWNLWVQIAIYSGAALLVAFLATRIPKIVAFLTTPGGRRGGMAGASVLLVLGILFFVNFLNYRHHQRVDLTEGGINSLSDQTVKVLENLDRNVEVIGFYEDPVGAQEFSELLKEYRFVSSRLEYEVVDPQKDPARAASNQIRSEGRVVVVQGQNRQQLDTLSEETLTNAIIKVTRESEKKIYFLAGHGERDIDESGDEGYSIIKQSLEGQNYLVENYNLAIEGKVPEDAALLVSAGPESAFFPGEVELIEEYLNRGGKFLLLVDPQNDFKMDDFLSGYGIQLDDNVVIDNSLRGMLSGLSAAAPLVDAYEPHPITEKMNRTTFFPFARSVEAVESSLGYVSKPLFSSSIRSWGETELVEGEAVELNEGRDKEGPLTMAVVSTKTIEQADEAGGSEASESEGEDETAAPEGEAEEEPEESEDEDGPATESRLVVYGDSDFVMNLYVGGPGGNADLFLNTVSWMVGDEDLVAVRPKDPTNRQIQMTPRDTRILFLFSVLALPLATLVLGISIWYRRR